MKNLKLGCVIMASGNARRFGANKLLADFYGEPLISRTFKAMPKDVFCKIAVVTQYDEVRRLAQNYGFYVIMNGTPEQGISSTVKLGTEFMYECDAVMFAVGDQPYLSQQTVCKAAELYAQNTDKIIAAAHNGKRGNPCIFPKRFFDELLRLTGDVGGSAVIKKHPESLMLFETDEKQLFDIDRPTDMYNMT